MLTCYGGTHVWTQPAAFSDVPSLGAPCVCGARLYEPDKWEQRRQQREARLSIAQTLRTTSSTDPILLGLIADALACLLEREADD
jgi:hypothetical protein